MTEELRLDELLGDGGAIDLHKGAVGAGAHAVEGVRDQLLAGAAFPVNQNPPLRGRRERQLLAQGLHGDAFADDAIAVPKFIAKSAVGASELDFVGGVLERQKGFFKRQRLLYEIEGAELGGADGGLDRPVSRNHDDQRRGAERPNFFKRRQAVHAGQPDIEQDQVEPPARQGLERGLRALHGRCCVAFIFEHRGKRLPDSGFVIHDEHRVFHGSNPSP